MEYKNFLPKEYVEKKKRNKNESYKRILVLLLIYNIILLPETVALVSKKEEKLDINIVTIDKIKEVDRWLNLNSKIYLNLKVSNNIGELIINNKNNLYKIEDAGFNIKEMISENNQFKIKVE